MQPTATAGTWERIRTGFSPVFWIANTIELFERLAFYGAKAVLAFYLANKIGLDLAATGWLVGMFAFLLWSMPVLAGVFVDHFGYKRTLATCFTFFTGGYFLIGYAGMPAGQAFAASVGKTSYVAAVLVVTAIGGSLIKPCIVGTVERTAHSEYRALGFSIYYALVNLGGAIGPIIASQVRTTAGIEFVFVMSAATSALMLVATVLFFREPEDAGPPAARRSFAQVFRNMLLVFGNLRFMVFLVIFSGFWIMFWQMFYSLPFYTDEILKFKRFEILETVEPWIIILLSVPLTAAAKKMRAMNAMTLGFVFASVSWLFLAFRPTLPAAIAGLVVFAIGEALQAPRFYDYVGRLAPRDQIGTYMGFAFLPIAIGSFIAGRLGTWLVEHYIRQTVDTRTMWLIVAGIGFASTALMVLYDRFIGREATDRG